ncbi:MAG: PIG-L deacetylase family protein [Calditrichia bacterium]
MLKRSVFNLVEYIWGRGFQLIGLIDRRRPFIKPERQRILVIAPHPDDETIGAGGAIVQHLEAGATVDVLIVTDGRRSKANGLATDEMITHRKQEAIQASKELRSTFTQLQLPEGTWKPDEFIQAVKFHISKAEIIYAPSHIDFHPEHLKVALVIAALAKENQRIRIMQLGVPLTAKRINCLIDISTAYNRKLNALVAYRTQQGSIYPLKRITTYQELRYGRLVECFQELTAAEYQYRVEANNWLNRNSPYRGIRSRPFSDPLAWLVQMVSGER